MTVRGAKLLDKKGITGDFVRYVQQDGIVEWHKEVIWTLERQPVATLDLLTYLIRRYDECPDRIDDDHDDWCRGCAPILWLLGR